jgi:DNA-binding transcriptional MerR regulator
LDELAARVAGELRRLAMRQPNGQVSAVPDTRTLRYYGTLGLIDRPVEVRGRRALYGERHVLQAVAIKALQSEGLTLGEIQQRLTGRNDDELRSVVARPGGARFWRQPAAPPASPSIPPPAEPAPPSIQPPAESIQPPAPATRPTIQPTVPPPAPATWPRIQPPTRSAASATWPTFEPASQPAVAESGAAGQGGSSDPIAVRLAAGVILLVEPARSLEPGDLDAVRRAGGALVEELARRGIAPRPETAAPPPEPKELP